MTHRYAPVLALPACDWCRHPWVSHWHDHGCQAPTGPGTVCGCAETPPDRPDHHDHDHDHGERSEETAA